MFESPRPISAWKRDAEILVAFDPRGSRLKTSSGGTPTGFEVAGADGEPVPVTADGDPFSYLGLPLLSCWDVGMPPIPRPPRSLLPRI